MRAGVEATLTFIKGSLFAAGIDDGVERQETRHVASEDHFGIIGDDPMEG